jgi:hypothetical protein
MRRRRDARGCPSSWQSWCPDADEGPPPARGAHLRTSPQAIDVEDMLGVHARRPDILGEEYCRPMARVSECERHGVRTGSLPLPSSKMYWKATSRCVVYLTEYVSIRALRTARKTSAVSAFASTVILVSLMTRSEILSAASRAAAAVPKTGGGRALRPGTMSRLPRTTGAGTGMRARPWYTSPKSPCACRGVP